MEWLLEDIDANGLATTKEEAEKRPIPDFEATASGDISSSDEERRVAAALEYLLRITAQRPIAEPSK
jgi:hypothetical protein